MIRKAGKLMSRKRTTATERWDQISIDEINSAKDTRCRWYSRRTAETWWGKWHWPSYVRSLWMCRNRDVVHICAIARSHCASDGSPDSASVGWSCNDRSLQASRLHAIQLIGSGFTGLARWVDCCAIHRLLHRWAIHQQCSTIRRSHKLVKWSQQGNWLEVSLHLSTQESWYASVQQLQDRLGPLHWSHTLLRAISWSLKEKLLMNRLDLGRGDAHVIRSQTSESSWRKPEKGISHYHCFIDFTNAFDRLQCDRLQLTMLDIGFLPHLVQVVWNLYRLQHDIKISELNLEWT